MTTNQTPDGGTPQRDRRKGPRGRMRRMLGVTTASAAIALGGGAAVPAATAQAAGVHTNQLSHDATLAESVTTTTVGTVLLAQTPRFTGCGCG